MKNLKILFLVNHLPYPPTRGDKTRDYNVIKFFSEKHDVHVCHMQKSDDPSRAAAAQQLSEVKRWEHTPSSKNTERILRFAGIARRKPSQIFSMGFFGLKRKIEELISQNNYDCIISEKFYAAGLIPTNCSTPVIIDNHNIEFIYYYSLEKGSFSRLRSLFYKLDYQLIKRFEGDLIRGSAGSVFLSKTDADYAKKSYDFNGPAIIVPQGVARSRLEKITTEPDPEKRSDLLFVGNLSQSRNFEPLCNFIEYTRSRLNDLPSFRMAIIGKGAPSLLTDLIDGKHFEYLGFQEDLDSWIQNTQLVYSYLPGGSGVKTKIIEGLAFNKRVICDHDSAHAVPDLIEHGILVSQSIPEAWEQTKSALLNKAPLPLHPHETQKYLQENYSWDKLIERFIDFTEELVLKSKTPEKL